MDNTLRADGASAFHNVVDPRDSAWYRATTLSERAASPVSEREGSQSGVAGNPELAERRFASWHSETCFLEDGALAKRLAADGLTEEDLLRLLGESDEELRDRFAEPPAWLDELAEAYCETPDMMPTQQATSESVAGFLTLIEPVIRRGRKRLRRGLEELAGNWRNPPFEPTKLEELMFAGLSGQLLRKLLSTMVLELNVARLERVLDGDTPEDRFRSFVKRLRRKDVALDLLREYPVLARQTLVCVNQWVEVSLEFADRLCEDWERIKRTFSLRNTGSIVGLEAEAGDRHRSGRSVYVATFSCGARVVYKPRSIAVDVNFHELLSWLNERGYHPPFRTLTVIDRGTYGWVEYVDFKPCASVEEVRRFYRRQGGYLALLYALHAADFHMDNIIACGEHPVLIDLEALFHPRERDESTQKAAPLATATLNRSVLGVGLLPQRLWAGGGNQEGVEISGLGGMAGQITPNRVPYWKDSATDEMHLRRKRMEMPGSKNRPILGGTTVNTLEYADELTSGFAEIYRLLARYQNEVSSIVGPLARFSGCDVRFIARPTMTYTTLLGESCHPDLLRDGLRRERFFDSIWDASTKDHKKERMLVLERKDLHRGDVPIFTSRPGSRDLWGSDGEQITDYFELDALRLAQERVRKLNEEDLARQAWLIRASLSALTVGEGQALWPVYGSVDTGKEATRAELVAAAQKVGDRLSLLALYGERDAAWLGLTIANERVWALTPAGLDLYNGLPGIALFLGNLSVVTGEQRYAALAERAIVAVKDQWRHIRSLIGSNSGAAPRLGIGAFEELAGTVFSFTHLSEVLNSPGLLDEAEELIELLPPSIDHDETFDVLGGAAGCICVLLGLHKQRPSSRALEFATRCGDHLIDHARSAGQGLGWPPSSDERPLTGFSHGMAGVAHALLGLSAATDESRFREVAVKAIAYERGTFSPEEENWPDLRYSTSIGPPETATGDHQFMVAWCHGAPGVGLGRLSALRHVDDPMLRTEIDAAVSTTLGESLGINHALCHGSLGNLELPLEAGRRFDDAYLLAKTYRAASEVLWSIDDRGWLCGVPGGVETPGLMTGLAGIGYGLLRLADPERVASVLTLEPPR